jgi:hypothetical protein
LSTTSSVSNASSSTSMSVVTKMEGTPST